MARRHHLPYIASAAISAAVVLPCLGVAPAHAATLDTLAASYETAEENYQAAVVDQMQGQNELLVVENEIQIAEEEFEQSKERLGNAEVELYKAGRHREELLDFVLSGTSLSDAMARYDSYMRVERACSEQLANARETAAQLTDRKAAIAEQLATIKARVGDAVAEMRLAEAELRDADHSDGARYHQIQGNSSNCGATAFIVGVNTLLHENRFRNNVKVWNGPGFEGDSTMNMGFKAKTWLMANGLAGDIAVNTIAGDIHTTAKLKAELDEGHVVIISSGPGSIWQRADGKAAELGTFPEGHWIVFYYEKDGVFYANDSSVPAKKGAGCAYTQKQMQQWLDGRSNHFAVSLAKKSLGSA